MISKKHINRFQVRCWFEDSMTFLLICHMYPYVNRCTLNIEMLPLTNFWVVLCTMTLQFGKKAHPGRWTMNCFILPRSAKVSHLPWWLEGSDEGEFISICFSNTQSPKDVINDDPTFWNDTRPPDCKEMTPVFQTAFQHKPFNELAGLGWRHLTLTKGMQGLCLHLEYLQVITLFNGTCVYVCLLLESFSAIYVDNNYNAD